MTTSWISSPVEIIQKDRFQGWCIPISSKNEIPLLISQLHEEIPAIKKATHPAMFAWRTAITAPKPPHIANLDQGKNDNGEKGAGERLVSILNDFKLLNVLLLVVRWHNGPNLGSKRFRVISKCGTQALLRAGWLQPKPKIFRDVKTHLII
ncbi:hypothetical protein KL907_001734 [Ogataea polymorpha]|nr:hypothetical protein KL907_001734 [Ogataea polymorpha]